MSVDNLIRDDCIKIEVNEDFPTGNYSPKVKAICQGQDSGQKFFNSNEDEDLVLLHNGCSIIKTDQYRRLTKDNEIMRQKLLDFLNGKINPKNENFRTFFLNGKFGTDSFCDLVVDKR